MRIDFLSLGPVVEAIYGVVYKGEGIIAFEHTFHPSNIITRP